MAVLLGGRAAEEVVFAHLSTGAADDLAKVTDIARSMVMRYGMVKSLGHVAYEEERAPFLGGPLPQGHREYSEETAREIDVAVREIEGGLREGARHPVAREARARGLGAEAAREGNARRGRARRAAPLAYFCPSRC